MEDQQILAQAMTWMRQREWREKLAKSNSGQSLYEHTLIELDAFLELRPILRQSNRYGLSELEEWIVIVSLIVHDAGKETPEWQQYVKSAGIISTVNHVIPELSSKLIPEICAMLALPEIGANVQQVIAECAGVHHDRAGRSDAAILKAMFTGVPARFVALASLVKAIDHFCSAESAADAARVARTDESLSLHVKVATNELIYRGVSTALFHEASRKAFDQAGWKPLLYFPTGTVYVADLGSATHEPSLDVISAALKTEIEAALKTDFTSMMVGSPTGNMLPKPDLFSFGASIFPEGGSPSAMKTEPFG